MEKIKANITGEIISSNDSNAHALYTKSRFGEKVAGKIQYSLPETLYLIENKKLNLYSRNKLMTKAEVLKRLNRILKMAEKAGIKKNKNMLLS